MDYQFPQQLFPSFYNCGPPDVVQKYVSESGGWGSYHGVLPQGDAGPVSSWTFTSKHQVRGETWSQTEAVVIPLLSPKTVFLGTVTPPDPLDFTEHMQNFFMDQSHDAFGCMRDILSEHFYFRSGGKKRGKHWRGSASMWKVENFIEKLKYKMCHQTYNSSSLNAYCNLLSDVIHDIPPDLLGSLLHDELTEQRDRMLFSEGPTGGALTFVPFSQSRGCLLYPGGLGLNCLTFVRIPNFLATPDFHKVELQDQGVDTSRSKPVSFQLKAPIRQISCTSLFNNCCVAVRSDHFCGVWRFSETDKPCLLQVINTREVSTCVSVSPHVLGEILVAGESGAANLWTVGKGLQKIRVENTNMYFNAKSAWRWCEFSAHPRVILYADRTGAELTDIRMSPTSGHTLFRISSSSECRSGERLLLSRYLGDVHSFHHLITTQHSAYIMDERFPCVPMLKWDHMMKAPPIFCQVIPHSAALDSAEPGTTKVLLGSQRSQEIMMLQYSGGRVEPCFSRGPPRALLQPNESLKHLPVQIPHRLEIATNRLSAPAAGLTCIQKEAGKEPGSDECVCVMQLTEAGDIFYQILNKLQDQEASRAPVAEDDRQPAAPKRPASQRGAPARPPADSQLIVSDTSSDENFIGPTQAVSGRVIVPETPDSSDSEDSTGRGLNLKQMRLQVFVNVDPELDEGTTNGDTTEQTAAEAEECDVEEARRSISRIKGDQIPVSLSSRTLQTWRHWLTKLMQKSSKKKSSRFHLQHFRTKTTDLLHLPYRDTRSPAEKKHVDEQSGALKSCMSKRSLLLHCAVSSIRTPGLVPVLNPVNTEDWTDTLSNRLTVSWQGEESWRAWWQDQLGMNKMTKMEALRRRRRKEKEARRAAGGSLDLSGSFTSSVSYQTDLDDFSSSAGWSSAASQGSCSDAEGPGTLSQVASTPFNIQSDSPVSTPTSTPQRIKGKHDDHKTPSRPQNLPLSQTGSHECTPASQKRTSRPASDYRSSLFETQDDASHQDPLQASASFRTFQTTSSFQPRDILSSLASSQTLAPSQASQGQRGPSQLSQLKKKRPRMGF